MSRLSRSVLCAILLFAPGCAEQEGAAPAKSTEPPPRVTMRMNLTPSLSNGCVMIAKDEGEFEREGIDVELVTLDYNSANMAIVSGQLDVFFAPMRAGIFNLIARGAKLQIVADKGHSAPGQCAPEAFTAPLATARRIEQAGFRGQKFAVVKGGIIEYLTDRLLAKHGLAENDVERLQLPVGDYLSVAQRQVDAVRFEMEPLLSNAVARGDTAVVASAEDVAPGAQLSCVVFGRRLLGDPELGRRFMRAYLRGVRRYNQGKTDRNVEIISRYTKLPPEVIRRSCWTAVSADGRIDPKAVEPFLQWAVQKGYLDKDVPAAAWWNPSFADAARNELDR